MLENHQSLSLSFFGEKKRVKPVDPAGSLALLDTQKKKTTVQVNYNSLEQ
jgi:hypothetical protein